MSLTSTTNCLFYYTSYTFNHKSLKKPSLQLNACCIKWNFFTTNKWAMEYKETLENKHNETWKRDNNHNAAGTI